MYRWRRNRKGCFLVGEKMEQKQILVKSSLDREMQPCLFYEAEGEEKRPLLVGLHTWSMDRFNQIDNMLPYAEKHGFHLLLPEFRGPNIPSNPNARKACGSKYVVHDIKDAIEYCIENFNVDSENIFLLGASGGGQIALLMSANYPKLFRAVGAFVPVCDVKSWYEIVNKDFVQKIEACCEDEEDMLARSPISYIDGIAQANVKIFHGKYDPLVPKEQSINLYFSILEKYPNSKTYLDIFDGGHEMDMELAMHWFLTQQGEKQKTEVTK